MGFVSNAFKSILTPVAQAVGLAPSSSADVSAPSTTGAAASATNSATSSAAAAAIAPTPTSTLLTGTNGVDPNKLQTSKVLLGQ